MDRSDERYARAVEILELGDSLVTTDHVLVETWNLLRGRSDGAAADLFWDSLRSSNVRLECVRDADLQSARSIGSDFPDQDFSIVDRTSFAVMMRLGITRAAAFDSHFAVFRYGPRRSLAFDVLR